MTAPKPRIDGRTHEQRIADLEQSLTPPRASQGGIAARAGILRASALACMVRDEDATGIGAYLDDLDRAQLYALVVALAAIVDPDEDVIEERLAWLVPIGVNLEHAAERARAAARRAAA